MQEHTLKEHQDVEVKLKPADDSKIVPAQTKELFTVNTTEEVDPLYKRSHKPLSISAPEVEEPAKPPEASLTKEDFDKQLELLKELARKVPSRRHDLYPYQLAWATLAKNRILDKKLGPFVGKLFLEYLGSDDHSLVQMVARMVANREEPHAIEKKVEKFLEEDAVVRVT